MYAATRKSLRPVLHPSSTYLPTSDKPHTHIPTITVPTYLHPCIHEYCKYRLHMCTHVYIYICVSIYIYTHTGLYMYDCLHTYMHMYIHAYTHACICTHIGKRPCINKCICAYTRAYVRTYIHTYIHSFIHEYLHTCMSPSPLVTTVLREAVKGSLGFRPNRHHIPPSV